MALAGCVAFVPGRGVGDVGTEEVSERVVALDRAGLGWRGWWTEEGVDEGPWYVVVSTTGDFCFLPLAMWRQMEPGARLKCHWQFPRIVSHSTAS